jgi:hypothetical protein
MSATVIKAPIICCEHNGGAGASIALRGDIDYMTASSGGDAIPEPAVKKTV